MWKHLQLDEEKDEDTSEQYKATCSSIRRKMRYVRVDNVQAPAVGRGERWRCYYGDNNEDKG